MKTGIAYHRGCLNHSPYPGNPEVAERVTLTLDFLIQSGFLNEIVEITPEPATKEQLMLVHTPDHIDYVMAGDNGIFTNPDTYLSEGTYEAASLATGAAIAAAAAVYEEDVDNAFCLVRPPGHHCNSTDSRGFCHFHNTAVAIRWLRKELGVKKVAVFDWDAHAGNGTMEIFYDDPDTLTVSVHQDPHFFYPGTGFTHQIGEGDGEGFNMNMPLQPGAGDGDYMHVLESYVADKISEFKPDFIIVAAGQDSHASDRISSLQVSDMGYCNMTYKMMELSKRLCKGRLMLCLEGGYNLQTLPQTHEMILRTLKGDYEPEDIASKPMESTNDALDELTKLIG